MSVFQILSCLGCFPPSKKKKNYHGWYQPGGGVGGQISACQELQQLVLETIGTMMNQNTWTDSRRITGSDWFLMEKGLRMKNWYYMNGFPADNRIGLVPYWKSLKKEKLILHFSYKLRHLYIRVIDMFGTNTVYMCMYHFIVLYVWYYTDTCTCPGGTACSPVFRSALEQRVSYEI